MNFSYPLSEANTLNTLIKDFLSDDPRLMHFSHGKASLAKLRALAIQKKFSAASRERLVEVMEEQYADLPKVEWVQQNIQALRLSNTFTITTGHQLCLATGPIYVIYKILSVVKACQLFTEAYPEVRAVPLFWMATEDHDADEISSVNIADEKYTWQHEQAGAVGRFDTHGITKWLEQWKHWIDEASFQLLSEAYRLGLLANATRSLIHSLFGEYGVVVLDGDHTALKRQFTAYMCNDLEHSHAFYEVAAQSQEMEAMAYKTQVNARPINLFYLEENKRTRIEKTESGFALHDASRTFLAQELVQLVNDHPERFSPNVILRPLYQEVVLPNLAYIGGPGEIAYWLQLKKYFDREDVLFPQLLLRDSAFLLTKKQVDRFAKLGVSCNSLLQPKEELVRGLVERAASISFSEEREALKKVFQKIKEKGTAVDKTLEAAAGAEEAKAMATIDHFEKKLMKAVKNKEEVNVTSVEKLWNELVPKGIWQERIDNFFVLKNKFANPLLPELLAHFNPFDAALKCLVIEPENGSDSPAE